MKLRRLTALLLACAMLCGCGLLPTVEEPASEQPAGEPALPEQPDVSAPEEAAHSYGLACNNMDGWNPYRCLSQENRVILPLLYEGLFEVAPDFTASPVLCESFTMSPDEMTYEFKLDSSAKFSDGSLLTSVDVVASYEYAAQSEYYKGRFAHIERFEVIDVCTVRVTLDAACGSLPLLLDIPITKSGTCAGARPTGSGPFVLQAVPLRLAPSQSYWRECALPIAGQTITLHTTQSPSEVRDRFELGEISLVCTDPTAGSACVYHSDYELWTSPSTVMVYLGFNCNDGPFEDAALRAQVTHLIDREQIAAEDFGGFASPVTLPASPLYEGYDRSLAREYGFDPSLFTAEPMFGEELTLLVNAGDSSRVAAARRIAAALRSVGFFVVVDTLPAEQYEQALLYGFYDCYLGEIRLTADFSLEEFFRPYGSARFGIGGHAAALSASMKMLENAGNSYDLYEIVMDEGLLCPILFKNYAVYCARGVFSNVTAGPYNVFYTAPAQPEAE